MIEFIESPLYNNWLIKHKPKKSFVLCSPYIKIPVVNQLFNNIIDQSIDITILIRGNEEEFINNNSSDIEVLEFFIERNGFDLKKFRRLLNLHMKAYLVDEKNMLICSGNMTRNGMFLGEKFGNAEGGIATDDKNTIYRFQQYFNKLWNKGEPLEIFYDEIENAYLSFMSNKLTITKKKKQKKQKQEHQYHLDNTNHKYQFSQAPKNGTLKELTLTLQVLNNIKDQKHFSYQDLGDRLRKEYNKRKNTGAETEKKKRTNDTKMGEEKVKLAEFLGMSVIDKTQKPYTLKISISGKNFLKGTFEEQCNILHDKLVRNDFFCDLYKFCLEELNANTSLFNKKQLNEKVSKYLQDNIIDAGEKTRKRIYSICNELLLFEYYFKNKDKDGMSSLLKPDKNN